MKAKKIFILLYIFNSLLVYSQRDAANWYFGNFAGLDFNLGNPQSFEGGALDTTEGCSSISDKDTGETLFYTEGTTVWNRNNAIMLNGTDLLGSLSSTQSAVIVPLPGNDDLFYIITTDEVQAYQTNGMGNGINYSIVSMSGDGGLGEVIEKNINLLVEGSEKISVVETADGLNYWVVTHFQNSFYSFLLSNSGIDTTPVISTLGPTIDDFENYRGAMKLSPDGSSLAIAHCLFQPSLGGLAYLYDFNNATGVVSNQELLSNDLVYYGVEFSSDSSKLYFSGKTLDTSGQSDRIIIEQFDLNVPVITNSRFTILDLENDLLSDLAGALQIAMNKKIYHSLPGSNLSVINKPKLVGPDVFFSQESVSLGISSSSFGLPQYIQSFFESFVTIDNTCENEQTTFTVDPSQNVIAAQWDFGDPASGVNNTSTSINTSHTFSTSGLFTVTVEFEFSDREPKTFVEFVDIIPQLDLPPSLTFNQCDLDAGNNGLAVFNLNSLSNEALELTNIQYTFFESLNDAQQDQNPIINPLNYVNLFNGQVIYLRVGDDLSCNGIVPITLNVSQSTDGDFGYTLCDVLLSKEDVWASLQVLKSEILLNYADGSDLDFYLTIDDLFNQVNVLSVSTVPHSFIALDFSNVFYRVFNGADCLVAGEVAFNILESVLEENKDIIYCASEGGVLLALDVPYASYLWSTGETTATIYVNQSGTYNVELTTLAGCDGRLQFVVTEVGLLDIAVSVQDFQQRNSIIITNNDPSVPLVYSINGGSTFQNSGVFNDLAPAYYDILVKDLNDCNEYSELLLIRGAPRLFTPNGDGINDFWHVKEKENYPGMKITVMDRFGKRITSFTNLSQGWDGTFNGREMPSNAYWYRIDYEGETYYGHFSLIRRGG